MSITRADMLTAVGYQYKYALTIKQTEAYEAIQWICDDIAGDFDGFRGLQDETEEISLTQDTAKVDVSSYLTDLRNNRIMKVALINSANHDDDDSLTERDYLSDYLQLIADPDNPSAAKDYDIPKIYARYGDYMYFYPVPDLTTLSIKIYFDKVHPLVSASQDILYPRDFKRLIVTGVVALLLEMADRKDGTITDRMQKYYAMKEDYMARYQVKPNLKRQMKMNW